MAKDKRCNDTSENLGKHATCIWTQYWEHVCPQQWPTRNRSSDPVSAPAAYLIGWQQSTTIRRSPGPHDCKLHLTLSGQWFTHRFTCTFQWWSSALILITSTAPFPPVQTPSSFDCRNIISLLSPLLAPPWSALSSSSLPLYDLVHFTALAAIWLHQLPHGQRCPTHMPTSLLTLPPEHLTFKRDTSEVELLMPAPSSSLSKSVPPPAL